jgi:hypothetical protein
VVVSLARAEPRPWVGAGYGQGWREGCAPLHKQEAGENHVVYHVVSPSYGETLIDEPCLRLEHYP